MRAPSAPAQECTTKTALSTPSFATPPRSSGPDFGRRVSSRTRCSSHARAVDQDHAVIFASRSPTGCRITSRLELAPCSITSAARPRHAGRYRRCGGCHGDLDHPALGGMCPLREQTPTCGPAPAPPAPPRQSLPPLRISGDLSAPASYGSTGAGFGSCPQAADSVDSGVIRVSSATLKNCVDTFAMCGRA